MAQRTMAFCGQFACGSMPAGVSLFLALAATAAPARATVFNILQVSCAPDGTSTLDAANLPAAGGLTAGARLGGTCSTAIPGGNPLAAQHSTIATIRGDFQGSGNVPPKEFVVSWDFSTAVVNGVHGGIQWAVIFDVLPVPAVIANGVLGPNELTVKGSKTGPLPIPDLFGPDFQWLAQVGVSCTNCSGALVVDLGKAGLQVRARQPRAIPEPSTFTLAAAGLAALLWRRRMHRERGREVDAVFRRPLQ